MLEIQKLYHAWNVAEYEFGCSTPNKLFLDELSALGINAKDYPEHKMWLLDYSQIDSIKNHPVVNECRGLIMGYDGQIIRKGFTRFYNLGENGVDTFDFKNSITFEKADGSLMFVYWCENSGQWEIGSRGTAFAEGPNEWHGTFRNFMLNAMGRTENEFQHACMLHLNTEITYLFEAVGPDNRIVTPYTTNHLIELGCVRKINFEDCPCIEIEYNFFANIGWNSRQIKNYKFNTQEDCMVALAALTGLEEGYVVYNLDTGGRVKVKNAVYLAAHRLRGNGLTVNAICELIMLNEVDEYTSVFKEDSHKFEQPINILGEMLADLNYFYNIHRNIDTQKEFAIAIKSHPLSAVMFKARSNDNNIIDEFYKFPISKRVDWLKDLLQK